MSINLHPSYAPLKLYCQYGTNTIQKDVQYDYIDGANGLTNALILVKDSDTGRGVNLVDIPDYENRLELYENGTLVDLKKSTDGLELIVPSLELTIKLKPNSNITLESGESFSVRYNRGSYISPDTKLVTFKATENDLEPNFTVNIIAESENDTRPLLYAYVNGVLTYASGDNAWIKDTANYDVEYDTDGGSQIMSINALKNKLNTGEFQTGMENTTITIKPKSVNYTGITVKYSGVVYIDSN